MAEQRGRGRPKVGGYIDVRLGDLLPRVDAWAEREGVERPEAIRRPLTIALDQRGVGASFGEEGAGELA